MLTTIDKRGRIVIPKPLRDELGLTPGTEVDISAYGAGLTVMVGGRSAVVEERAEGPVIVTGTVLDDATLFRLIDEGKR